MKLFPLSTISAALFFLLPCLSASASPRGLAAPETEYGCFMVNNSGQVVDLTESVCKANKSATKTVSADSDQEFIKEYKRVAATVPNVGDGLLLSAQKTPEQGIAQAKRLCEQLKEGLSIDEIKVNQSEEIFEEAEVANADIINNLATKHYCPELSEQ